jgi:putative MATE family efflux protein
VIFLIIGLTVARQFFVVQGASETIADYGHSYLAIILCLGFGAFGQMIFERLLQATGKTIYTMFTQGTGAIINIILDPILIFGYFGMPKMGIAGAALATVIGQTVAAIMAITFNLKVNNEIHFSLKEFRPSLQTIRSILYIGIPSVIMVAIGSVMTFSVNKILVVFSSTAVAVFGAYFKLQSFAFMPVFGLNNGMIPIVAYNYGARKPKRILQTFKSALVCAVTIMLIALVIVQLFPGQLLGLFNASEEMLAIGIPALRIITTSFIFAGVSVVSSSFFQALGNGVYSTITSFTRQLVFLVPLAYLFSKTGELSKVWLAWPIAELASIALCVFFLRRIYRKIVAPMMEGNR